MKKICVITLLLLLTLPIVYAEFSFDVSINPDEQKIKTTDLAEYTLQIAHNRDTEEEFQIYSQDIVWDVRTEKNLIVTPGKKGLTTKLFIQSLNANPGFYGIPIVIKPLKAFGEKKQIIFLDLIDPYQTPPEYLPAIRGVADIEKQIDPREPIILTLTLENQNRKNLTNLEIKIRSKLLYKDHLTTLGELTNKEVVFNFSIDPQTVPQKDTIKISVFAHEPKKSYQFDIQEREYEIKPISNVEKTPIYEKGFLKRVKKVVVENKGNVPESVKYSEQLNFFSRLFTKVEPQAGVVKGSYIWETTLNVRDKKEFIITTNYWPLFVTLLILAILTVVYYMFRSPLVLNKKAKIVSTKEGGISEMKILLTLKNRSLHHIKNVKIIDVVPNVGEYVKHAELGTISLIKEPTVGKIGTILNWTMPNLEPLAEVIVTYRIKMKYAVLEGFSLPVAVAKFETRDIERSTKSNVYEINF